MRRALLAAVLAAALPAAAEAPAQIPAQTLVYQTGTSKTTLWAANWDGSGRRVLVKGGQLPVVSPNGLRVAYIVGFSNAKLRVIPAAGGAPVTVASHVWNVDAVRWAPDNATLSVTTGPELGPYTLKLVNADTGAVRSLNTGRFFGGVSFAPDGSGVVWSRAASDAYPMQADLYETDLLGGPITRLTTTRDAISPVWGPQKIVYSRERKPKKKNDADKLDLYTINPDGTGGARLTTTTVPFLLSGLTATGWSDDGTRLLAEYGGQDTSEAWRVDPATGSAKDVTGKFDSVIGYALSHDGSTILGRSGSFDDPHGKVVAIDYATGRRTVLATNASWASWNR
jgi:Tol biopolymer transport system component